jgi:hypothetical protein
MKFALLGADADSCLLTQAAADLGHQIVWYGDVGIVDRTVHPWLTNADQASDWEALYDGDFCDFVIIGTGELPADRRAEQVIQLVKNGVSVLTTFPLSDSVLSYYEIDMARAESDAVLYHFNPLTTHDQKLAEFTSWVVNGHPRLGRIEQLLCERPLENRTRENVIQHFSRDVELLDRIAGPIDRLSALGSPDASATYSGLSVQLLGKTHVPIRWSVGPVDRSPQTSLTFVGQRGRVSLEYGKDGHFVESKNGPSSPTPLNAATECINQFAAAIDGLEATRTTWPAALRAMELTDTIEISLRRGRMIDVHRQQLTEELSFRGTMSAVGCGVLMLLPPLLIFAGWIGELLGLQFDKNWWAYGLLGLLGLFLLVQFAPKLLIKKNDSTSSH